MSRYKLRGTRYPGVYRREHDDRYVVRVKVLSEKTGKHVERSKTMPAGATLTEARLEAESLREEGRAAARTQRMPSVLDYSVRWVARKVARREWREGGSTQDNVERHLRLHILPVLGDYLLDRVTPTDLQLWLDNKFASGAKIGSVRSWWITLKNLLSDGAAEYQLPDPTARISLPRGASMGRGRDMVLLPEQVRLLLSAAADDAPETWYLPLVLGFASGARVGEVMAVHVRDLDLGGDIGVWQVSRHVVAKRVVDGTKNGKVRTSYLDPGSTALLRSRWLERRRHGDDAFMFPGRYERCLTPTGLHMWLKRTTPELGLPPLSSKTFRQTYITLAAIANVGTALTRAQVGHADESIHRRYTRVPDAPRQEAAAQMGRVIFLADRASEVGQGPAADDTPRSVGRAMTREGDATHAVAPSSS